LHRFPEHGPVADVIGEEEDELGVDESALRVGQVAMQIDQVLIEVVGHGEVGFGVEHGTESSTG
jgi:hypothetical protein